MGKTKEITRQELDLVMAAVKKLFTRNSDGARFNYDHLGGCFGGMWCGMYIGIELDGHTHS